MKKSKRALKWLAVLGAVVICCAVGVTVWLVRNPAHTLFQLDPEQVTAITVKNGNKLTRKDITDPEECREIVELLNGFTYRTTHELPPAGGWSYLLEVETVSGGMQIDFSASSVKGTNQDGSSTIYRGPEGYFLKLVDLAESATDPI
jgi:hypothetical protein